MSELAYAAHTRTAIFFLDAEGVCQDVAAVSDEAAPGPELLRCVGAQYVATLDMTSPGGLVALPKVGAAMLFVVADAHMRFSLVRTAAVDRFETLGEAQVEQAPMPAPEVVTVRPDSEIPFALLPQIKVTWPSADVLARGLPMPAFGPSLMAPARPRRAAL